MANSYYYRDDAKTFGGKSFYYVNFIDEDGDYDANYSIRIDNASYAKNKARWYVNNLWALRDIPYYVCKVGVYDSRKGHVCSYDV